MGVYGDIVGLFDSHHGHAESVVGIINFNGFWVGVDKWKPIGKKKRENNI